MNNTISYTDPRTNKTYYSKSTTGYESNAMQNMMSVAEYDYQQTLPPEQRSKKVDTEFKCPLCKTHNEPAMRKQLRTSLFSSWLQDIYCCTECKKEFTEDRLDYEISSAKHINFIYLQQERVKDGEIDPEDFNGIVSAFKY